VIRAGAAYFALVFAAGFLLGLVRVPLLVPQLGERVAELLEMPVMLVVIFFVSRYIVRRFALADHTRRAAGVGLLALALLLMAELALTVAPRGGSIADYIVGRDPVAGSVYLGSLIIYAAMPWLHVRWSKRGSE